MEKLTSNPRKQFLKQMGLKIDPFVYSISELELEHSTYFVEGQYKNGAAKSEELYTPFLEYFVQPTISHRKTPITLEKLRESQHSFIFGESGSGKTMLRLMLEARMRLVPDIPNRSLVVTHSFRVLTEKYWLSLAQALSIDFVIQLIEQFHLQPSVTEEKISALTWQISMGGPQVRRLAERYIKEPESESQVGLGILWPQVGRTALKRVYRHPKLVEVFKKILAKDDTCSQEDLSDSYDILERSFRTAKTWGFKKIFILIDDLNDSWRSEAEIMTLLQPLFEKLREWRDENIYLKGFLPTRLQKLVKDFLKQRNFSKTFVYTTKIKWTPQSLRNLLMQRLRTGGSRHISFNDFASPGLELEENLLHAARGQPSRLLRHINRLIDLHVRRDPNEFFFSIEDWNNSKKQEDILYAWPDENP